MQGGMNWNDTAPVGGGGVLLVGCLAALRVQVSASGGGGCDELTAIRQRASARGAVLVGAVQMGGVYRRGKRRNAAGGQTVYPQGKERRE